MGIRDRALNLIAPRPAAAPPRPQTPFRRSAAFSITLPSEMTGDIASPVSAAPKVSRELALQVPAVKRTRDLIAGTLGTLELCQMTVPGYVEVFNALLKQPEEDTARSVTMTRTVEDMLFEERAWWRIVGFGSDGFPDRIVRLEAASVTVTKTGKVWSNDRTLQAQGVSVGYQPDSLLIRIDSPNPGLLTAGARAIRTALMLGDRADQMAKDPQQVGYVTPKGDVDLAPDFDADEMLDDMEDARQRRSWGYVGAGLELHQMQWSAEQLQFMSQRDYAVLEIARIGGLDPEELGVSTTSRTYANAEQRRLDLLDFTLKGYITAIQDRLSMSDVTAPGREVYVDYDGFLRSDTPSRMDVYDKGRRVGAYDDARIAKIERIPITRVRKAMEATAPADTPETTSARAAAELLQKGYLAVAAGVISADELRDLANRAGAGLTGSAPTPPATQPATAPATTEETVTHSLQRVGAKFSGQTAEMQFTFEVPPDIAQFKVDSSKRTIVGLALPWDTVAKSGGKKWAFAPGSLHWSDTSRVKLDKDHGYGTEFGVATEIVPDVHGLRASFKVARGTSGDDALGLAEDRVYDGLSVFVTFDGEADGWIPHPDNADVQYVQSATLRKVALTAMPAFDDARVQSVAATRKDNPMTAPAPPAPDTAPVVPVPAAPPATMQATFDSAAFTAGLTESLKAAFGDLIAALPAPQRTTVPAGRLQSVREPMVYQMNGRGESFVRDAWKALNSLDVTGECRDRLRKFEAQTIEQLSLSMEDPTFAINTGNAAAVVPPGYRPDMYVSQLLKGRPATNAISRGTIGDATPFTVPAFVSSTLAAADHVEGVNPSEGSLSVAPVTITPAGISGLYKITREMADSANPAIDAIATQAMSEGYSQITEAKVYTELNGTNGVGGTITSGFVPSGAQAVASVVDISNETPAFGKAFLNDVRTAMALYPFRRFAQPDFALLSQEGTTTFASAVDTTGRPLLPWVGPNNVIGTANTLTQGYFIDGLVHQPCWSMSGNAVGDSDVIMGNRNDVWCWESPTLMFRFEERSGPGFIELALFGYFAVRVLRPVGLSGVRLTVQA
jgi:phage head maturation protease